MTDERQEYEAALAAYAAAQERLIEAKRHYDPKTAPEAVEQRRAKQAAYRVKRHAERNTPEYLAKLKEDLDRMRQWIADYQRRDPV